MKRCSKCKESKSLSCFGKSTRDKDGLKNRCKDCRKIERQQTKAKKSPDQIVADKEKNRLVMRKWRSENKERNAANTLAYGRSKGWQAQKAWQKQNREYLNEKRRDKYKNDIVYKVACDIRSLVSHAWSENDYKKSIKTHEIIGCSFDFFWEHLIETCLKRYGEYWVHEQYHIDHIIPISSARTEEELLKLNHYSNLQLLLEQDNLRKGSKLFNSPCR
jgi:hypothetical protein